MTEALCILAVCAAGLAGRVTASLISRRLDRGAWPMERHFLDEPAPGDVALFVG